MAELVTTDMEKAEIVNNIFALVFTGSHSSHIPEVPEPQDRLGSEISPTVSEDWV